MSSCCRADRSISDGYCRTLRVFLLWKRSSVALSPKETITPKPPWPYYTTIPESVQAGIRLRLLP